MKALLVLFSALTLTTHVAPASAQEASVAEGRQILQTYCARCHSISETGESPHAEAPAFRYLGRKYEVGLLAEALAEGIMTGHPDMPVFTFTASEVDHIIAYLESIQRR